MPLGASGEAQYLRWLRERDLFSPNHIEFTNSNIKKAIKEGDGRDYVFEAVSTSSSSTSTIIAVPLSIGLYRPEGTVPTSLPYITLLNII